MINTKFFSPARIGGALLGAVAALGGMAASAQQHVEEGRVISATPINSPNGTAGYSVTYEYNGRQYTTRTDSPPGDYIQLQVSPMGVATSTSQYNPPQYTNDSGSAYTAPVADNGGGGEPWRNVQPEPGVVLSGNSGGAVAPMGVAAPVYAAPPVVYAPAPVYAPAYGYGYYGYPYGGYPYPPVGVSLNLGYSYYRGGRGWH